ncbi:serine/arginine repetitive matrix protein 2-like isoform X3 [Frankliniella occidentalis]|uniref:Serine/arginine repetitive matrix protein 2-like isoform X3 n=1 Tax=Frankliniella occidentalis TaxID=133901 RepID=A0A9C6U4B8_FRAOC|nr:serine/arginine repetitive matrix protein 2-like isoform X3 [Frankliniella occidentalis]
MAFPRQCQTPEYDDYKIARFAQLGLMPTAMRSDPYFPAMNWNGTGGVMEIDGSRRDRLSNSAQKKFRRWSRRLNGQHANGTGWVMRHEPSRSANCTPYHGTPEGGGRDFVRRRARSQGPPSFPRSAQQLPYDCDVAVPSNPRRRWSSRLERRLFKPQRRLMCVDEPLATELPPEPQGPALVQRTRMARGSPMKDCPVGVSAPYDPGQQLYTCRSQLPSRSETALDLTTQPGGRTDGSREKTTSLDIETLFYRRAKCQSETEKCDERKSPVKTSATSDAPVIVKELRGRRVESPCKGKCSTVPVSFPLDANTFFGNKDKSRRPSTDLKPTILDKSRRLSVDLGAPNLDKSRRLSVDLGAPNLDKSRRLSVDLGAPNLDKSRRLSVDLDAPSLDKSRRQSVESVSTNKPIELNALRPQCGMPQETSTASTDIAINSNDQNKPNFGAARRRRSSQDSDISIVAVINARDNREKPMEETPKSCAPKSSKKSGGRCESSRTPASSERTSSAHRSNSTEAQKTEHPTKLPRRSSPSGDLKPKAIIKPGLRSAKKDPKKTPAAKAERRRSSPIQTGSGTPPRKLVQKTLDSFFCKESSGHVRRIYQDEEPKQPVVRVTPLEVEERFKLLADRPGSSAAARLALVTPIPSPAKKRPCEDASSPPRKVSRRSSADVDADTRKYDTVRDVSPSCPLKKVFSVSKPPSKTEAPDSKKDRHDSSHQRSRERSQSSLKRSSRETSHSKSSRERSPSSKKNSRGSPLKKSSNERSSSSRKSRSQERSLFSLTKSSRERSPSSMKYNYRERSPSKKSSHKRSHSSHKSRSQETSFSSLKKSSRERSPSSFKKSSRESSQSKRSSRDRSPVKKSSREGSPSKNSSRERSPSKKSSQNKSPSNKSSRGSSPPKTSSRDQSPSKKSFRESSSSKKSSRDQSPSKKSSRESSSSKKSSRDKSPSKKSSRDKSPSKKSSRESSPSKKSSRDESPSIKSSRDKSPSKKSSRDKSPSKKSSRERSPSKKSSRERSPSKKSSRERSPSKTSSRERSPSKRSSCVKRLSEKSSRENFSSTKKSSSERSSSSKSSQVKDLDKSLRGSVQKSPEKWLPAPQDSRDTNWTSTENIKKCSPRKLSKKYRKWKRSPSKKSILGPSDLSYLFKQAYMESKSVDFTAKERDQRDTSCKKDKRIETDPGSSIQDTTAGNLSENPMDVKKPQVQSPVRDRDPSETVRGDVAGALTSITLDNASEKHTAEFNDKQDVKLESKSPRIRDNTGRFVNKTPAADPVQLDLPPSEYFSAGSLVVRVRDPNTGRFVSEKVVLDRGTNHFSAPAKPCESKSAAESPSRSPARLCKRSPTRASDCGSPAKIPSSASKTRTEVADVPTLRSATPRKPVSPTKVARSSPAKVTAARLSPAKKTASPTKAERASPAKRTSSPSKAGRPSPANNADDIAVVIQPEEELLQAQQDRAASAAEAEKAAQRNKQRHTRGRKVYEYCPALDEHLERHPAQNEIPADKWVKWLNPTQLRCLSLAMLDNADLCLRYSLEARRVERWEAAWVSLARRLNTICYNRLTNLNTGLRLTVMEWKKLWLDMRSLIRSRVEAMPREQRRHGLGSLECLLFSEDLYKALMKSKGECLGEDCPRIWCSGACVGVFCPTIEQTNRRGTEE